MVEIAAFLWASLKGHVSTSYGVEDDEDAGDNYSSGMRELMQSLFMDSVHSRH